MFGLKNACCLIGSQEYYFLWLLISLAVKKGWEWRWPILPPFINTRLTLLTDIQEMLALETVPTLSKLFCKYSNASTLININDNMNSFHYVLPIRSNYNNRRVLSNLFLKMTLYQNWRW